MRISVLLPMALILLCCLPASAQDAKRQKTDRALRTATATASQGAGGLLSEDFEGVAEPNLPAGWTAVNANGDDMEWGTQNNPDRAHDSAQFAVVYWNQNEAADDWLFTPGVALEAGTSYSFEVWFRPGEFFPGLAENFEIKYGDAPEIASMMETLYQVEGEPTGPYIRVRANVVPAASGEVFFGFHCYSPADQYFCGIDDVSLVETPSTPVLDADVSAIDFGLVGIGDTATRRLTLVNIGGAPLSLGEVTTSSGDFSVDLDGLDTDLEPNDTTSLVVTFAPSGAGPVVGRLEIASDDPGSPFTIDLSGEGGGALTFSGDTSDGPLFHRPSSLGNGTSGSCDLSGLADAVPYEATPFTVGVDGPYQITLTWNDEQDGYLLVYEGAFDAADPCQNLISRNDDGTSRANSQLLLDNLEASSSYVIVATGFANDDFGAYDGEILGPGAIATASEDEGGAQPARQLSVPYPNPARERTEMRFASERSEQVRVEAYDLLGRRVATLFDGHVEAGEERVLSFDTSALPAGVYVVRAQSASAHTARRVTVVR